MNAQEMEEWLLSQGAIPVTEEMKKEPWYEEVSKLPPCMLREAQESKKRASRLKGKEA